MMEFERENVPLVLSQAETQQHVSNKKRLVAATALAIIGAIVFACIVGSLGGSAQSDLVNLEQINQISDIKMQENTIYSQVSQIMHRSTSLNEISKPDEGFSNIGSINQIWKTLVSSENLSEADKTIAQDILDLMESYKIDRESNLNLAEKENLFKSNWSKIFAELKTKMNTDVARNIVDLQDSAYETALGSKKAVAKVNTCKSGDASTCKCGDLAWYKRWWNTMKGWFGSKVTNCIKAAVKKTMIDLKAKKAAVLGACGDLAWYKRWWNTIKGWFGSKVTNCIKASAKASFVILNAVPKLLCSKLPWYKRWWNTMKGWFGSKTTNCIVAKSAFFEKFGKIVNEGLALELYTQNPTAVLKNLPSFTDNAPMSDRIRLYNEFAKAKGALLSYDSLDAKFLNLVENYIKTWAITPEQELNKLHDAFLLKQD